MRRTWGLDVLVCARCSGPMRLVAMIDAGPVADKILAHLNLPTQPPPRGPPWARQAELPFGGDIDQLDTDETSDWG